MAERIRLQKFFTDCGTLSRRAAEAEIARGLVLVNGSVAKVGDKIDPDCDVVEYRGRQLRPREKSSYIYIMLHKPVGYVTTSSDEKKRRTVLDLTRGVGGRIYPIGRLDMNSEGLLLLTNDGSLTNRLTHPRHEIPKIYRVTVSTVPTEEQIAALSSPMQMDGYLLQPVGVRRIGSQELEMTLYEGRNRQIRRMCEAVGLRISKLCRIAIGKLELGDLPMGHWRHLSEDEVRYLYGKQN